MTAAVALPLWSLLLLVAATPAAGWLGARNGAKNAIKMCSAHWGCAMMADKKRKEWNEELVAKRTQTAESHPELAAIREAAARALRDTGSDLPVVPERRPQQDRDRDGHK